MSKNPLKLHSCGTLARGLSYAMKQCKIEGDDDMAAKVAATWLYSNCVITCHRKHRHIYYDSHSCKAAEAYKADLIKRLVTKQKEVAAANAAKAQAALAKEKEDKEKEDKKKEDKEKEDKEKEDKEKEDKEKEKDKGLVPQPGSEGQDPPSTPQHRIRRRRSPPPPVSPPLPAPAHPPSPSEAEPPFDGEVIPSPGFADPSLVGKFDVEPGRCPDDYPVMESVPETTRPQKDSIGERPVAAPLRSRGDEMEAPKDVTRTN